MNSLSNQPKNTQKLSIIKAFHHYVTEKYGDKMWSKLLSSQVEGFELYYLINNYGTAAFQDAVNLLVDEINSSVSDVLKQFGMYYDENKEVITISN